MSELSAKHKALNILQVLSSESKGRSAKTSPRPDLSASQEILSGKYRELATLLATQHVERKTLSRLKSIDLVSRRLGDAPTRLPRNKKQDDNQEKPSRRRQRRKLLVSVDNIPKTEPVPCLKAKSETTSSQVEIDLKLPENSPPDKKVSFGGARMRLGIDGYASSSTDVSDTEIIRRILRSPRRVVPDEVNTRTSVKSERRKGSPRKRRTAISKKKPGKQKGSPKQLSKKDDGPAQELSEPQEKKEVPPSDHKLNTSSNPDVLSWLRAKNKLIRKEKRSERKKERLEHLAEQRVAEKKTKKLVESEEKVTEWMKEKKVESIIKRRVEKKIRKEKNNSQQHPVQSSPDKQTSSVAEANTQRKSPRPLKSSASGKDNIDQKKDNVDEEQRHHLVRNLEAERLHAEEKRQRKEAERRRKRLLKEAQITKDSKTTDPQPSDAKKLTTNSDSKKVGKSSRETLPETKATPGMVDKAKNRPSSNLFKGMSYDDWLKQKQTLQRKEARDAKKQEVCDPELDDLIPLLARRRIEQIKIRSTRVDSGLRRSQSPSSLKDSQSEKPISPNGVRPYTWNSPTNPLARLITPKSSTNRTTSKKNSLREGFGGVKNKMASSMPDVINFVERPEPQGCEGSPEFPCQSPNQSKENTETKDQSQASRSNSKITSAIRKAPIDPKVPKETSTTEETIFMTEPQNFGK